MKYAINVFLEGGTLIEEIIKMELKKNSDNYQVVGSKIANYIHKTTT
jgi:hypothetical protein